MRKICCLLLALAFILHPLQVKGAEIQNWYFRFDGADQRPTVMGGSTLPDQYGALYMGNAEEKVIYLTFDAGYVNENVNKILDTLKAHHIKATFFILPAVVQYSLPTAQRMIDDGHLICNHSTTHRNMGKITRIEDFKKELTDTEEIFRQATGKEMAKFFRPPEGAFTEDTLRFCKELGYTPVFWSFAYADWDNGKQPNLEDAKQKILSRAHNGEIMLLHPNSATNAAILDDVITALEEEGYTFATVDTIVYQNKQ